jgi:nucleoside-diphosphate-sugar epimerase
MQGFVTGGGRGFIGGHVVQALERTGHEVRREWVDVRDGVALLRSMRGCDAVVHACTRPHAPCGVRKFDRMPGNRGFAGRTEGEFVQVVVEAHARSA